MDVCGVYGCVCSWMCVFIVIIADIHVACVLD